MSRGRAAATKALIQSQIRRNKRNKGRQREAKKANMKGDKHEQRQSSGKKSAIQSHRRPDKGQGKHRKTKGSQYSKHEGRQA